MNKDVRLCGAAAAASAEASVDDARERKKEATAHFEGHCTSKNGVSPELKLINAPVLETPV